MAATNVQVLCPNGRRQNVKVNPNTKLLQVLEEVCRKQGFLPPEAHSLKHGRNELDMSLSIRYVNLANNAKLELIKATTSRAEKNVLIALQLEDGRRLQKDFVPSTTLWEILQHWETEDQSFKGLLTYMDTFQEPPVHPVCVYMREEVIGEYALKRTQLRKLGLTEGRAIIRLIHRGVDDLVLAQAVDEMDREEVKKAKLEQLAAKNLHGSVDATQAASVSRESLEMNLSDTCDGEPMDTHDLVADNPQSDIGPNHATKVPAAISNLSSIPGVQVFTPDDFNSLSSEEQQTARALARSFLSHVGMAQEGAHYTQSVPVMQKGREQQFSNFKFPEATKGKNLYHNELSSVSGEEFMPCERQAVVYSLDENKPHIACEATKDKEDLPDQFFDITKSDVMSMMADLREKVKRLDSQILMTRSMREQQLESRYQKYKRAVIRIQFSDKLVLQGVFKPRETIFALQKFVKSYLEDKSVSFYLFTSPPRNVFKDNTVNLMQIIQETQSPPSQESRHVVEYLEGVLSHEFWENRLLRIANANLVPASLVYFGSEQHRDHHLLSSVRAELVSLRRAEEIAVSSFRLNTPDLSLLSTSLSMPSTSLSATSNSAEFRDEPSTSGQLESRSRSTPKVSAQQFPKWFKPGKRKE